MDLVFKALSGRSRRKILELLKEKDLTVGEISPHFSFTAATLSHHLAVLKKARLVTAERDGQFLKYSLNLSVFEELTEVFLNIFKFKKVKKK